MLSLTSVFPSTTVAALTTLWTGQPPGRHGFLGAKLLLAEQGVLANVLALSPDAHRQRNALIDWDWEPETFVTLPSLGQQLTDHGVRTIAHTHSSFIGDGLNRIFNRGMEDVRGHLLTLDTEQAIAAGLFGPRELPLDLRSRVGDLLLLAQDGSRLRIGEKSKPFHGHHGSMTPEEMLVPLLMVRLD